MSADLIGLGDVIQSLREYPDSLDVSSVLERVTTEFERKLKESTPPGYSGRLQRSVVSSEDGDEILVGYEEGVETAGNPRLDSVLRPKTRGRSVLWVKPSKLDEILASTADGFGSEAVSMFESVFDGAN